MNSLAYIIARAQDCSQRLKQLNLFSNNDESKGNQGKQRIVTRVYLVLLASKCINGIL